MNWDQIAGVELPQGESTMPGQGRIGDLWCRLMHTEPMWPVHGQYECRTCGRRFHVDWEQPPTVTANLVEWQSETQAQTVLVAGRPLSS
jgi:hypothetical protein